jgi:hypothetical protein
VFASNTKILANSLSKDKVFQKSDIIEKMGRRHLFFIENFFN